MMTEHVHAQVQLAARQARSGQRAAAVIGVRVTA
jgi:hypothetical protein